MQEQKAGFGPVQEMDKSNSGRNRSMIIEEAAPSCLKRGEGVLERKDTHNKFWQQDYACAVCGKSVETIKRILFECGRTCSDVDTGWVTLPEDLGFRANKVDVNESAAGVRKPDWKIGG